MSSRPTPERPVNSERASGSAPGVGPTAMPMTAAPLVAQLPRLQALQAQVNDMSHLMRLLVAQGDGSDPLIRRVQQYLKRHRLEKV